MKTRVLVLTTLGTVMMFPEVSDAGDGKRYNGGLCQVADNTLVHRDGWAYNSGVSALTIDCPTVRDNSGSANLTVFAIDRHYYDDVGCYGASLTTGAGASPWWGWWTTVTYSSGSNANMQALSLGTISGNSTSLLYITCFVPPLYAGSKSGIFGYHVNED